MDIHASSYKIHQFQNGGLSIYSVFSSFLLNTHSVVSLQTAMAQLTVTMNVLCMTPYVCMQKSVGISPTGLLSHCQWKYYYSSQGNQSAIELINNMRFHREEHRK